MKKKLRFLKKLLKLGILCFILFLLFNLGMFAYCLMTPKLEINESQSYYLYDSKGELIFNDNDDWISLEDISPYLISATIDTEDKYFYKHFGFDYFRILKAFINNIKSGSLNEGASTITQQYARNLFLNYDKTWSRKLSEAKLAFELETHYSKDEILEGYLNTINYGGVFGVENASWYYFGHSASELSLAEASMLAGIPQSPANYSPIANEELAKKRQKIVLRSMVNQESISEEEMDLAYNTNLTYIGKSNKSSIESLLYYRDAVLKELDSIGTIPDSLVEVGGLKIYTCLDIEAQEQLETAVNNNKTEGSELQLAGIMLDPNSGGVLALMGGIDYSISQYNRAISAKRQVGSTMKPLLYYAALEQGLTSASSFISEKTTFTFSNNQVYTPKNYNDTYGNSAISMGAAIAYSDNIYAVKTHLFLGEEVLVNYAHKLGITSELSAIASLALGTEEISLIEMVTAYSSFANMGYSVDSHFITRVEDNDGNVLYEYKDTKEEILDPNLTFILNEMLTYTYDSSFVDYNYPTVYGLSTKMTNKYCIKTGTTDTDMLVIGYNKNAVLGIWSGYDDNRKISTGDGNFHKNVWIDTMEGYLKDKNNEFYSMPSNVVGVLVNPITGQLLTETDNKGKIFYFLKGTEPTSSDEQDLEKVWNEEWNAVDAQIEREKQNEGEVNDNSTNIIQDDSSSSNISNDTDFSDLETEGNESTGSGSTDTVNNSSQERDDDEVSDNNTLDNENDALQNGLEEGGQSDEEGEEEENSSNLEVEEETNPSQNVEPSISP